MNFIMFIVQTHTDVKFIKKIRKSLDEHLLLRITESEEFVRVKPFGSIFIFIDKSGRIPEYLYIDK